MMSADNDALEFASEDSSDIAVPSDAESDMDLLAGLRHEATSVGAGEASPLVIDGECEGPLGNETPCQMDGIATETLVEIEGDCKWVPGKDCGVWLGRHCALGSQAQVLIANVVLALQRLGLEFLRKLRGALGLAAVRSMPTQIGSALLCLPQGTVQNIFYQLQKRCWEPMARMALGGVSPSVGPPQASAACPRESDVESRQAAGLRALVRVALANAVERGTAIGFAREVQRSALAGQTIVHMATPEFFRLSTSFASMVLSQMDAADFNGVLIGLGIPSDFSILVDPVSVGVGVVSRHDSLCVICLQITSRWTGQAYTPMHSAPAMPLGAHSGKPMAELIATALAAHPANWDTNMLAARTASICGDGALCQGGPEHRHRSSAAAEKLWSSLHPQEAAGPAVAACPPAGADNSSRPQCTVWDPFHRVDNGAWRAIRQVPMAVHIFDVSKLLDNMFGTSEGVLIYRGAAEDHAKASTHGNSRPPSRSLIRT